MGGGALPGMRPTSCHAPSRARKIKLMRAALALAPRLVAETGRTIMALGQQDGSEHKR